VGGKHNNLGFQLNCVYGIFAMPKDKLAKTDHPYQRGRAPIRLFAIASVSALKSHEGSKTFARADANFCFAALSSAWNTGSARKRATAAAPIAIALKSPNHVEGNYMHIIGFVIPF
jgi:hypothetical protein